MSLAIIAYGMLTLALDTTTPVGSCAIARDGQILCEMGTDGSRPQAARLPEELMSLLAAAHVSLGDIDLYAVATGPGSFTGLRVGIAAMQGLAFAHGKPLIGVSGLEALAKRASESATFASFAQAGGERVATWVDAWRGEVYAAAYVNGREIDAPIVAPPDYLLQALRGSPTFFIGDGAQANQAMISSVVAGAAYFADPLAPRLAGAIAEIATTEARAGHAPSPHAIAPLYVRRPDAELARDARAAH